MTCSATMNGVDSTENSARELLESARVRGMCPAAFGRGLVMLEGDSSGGSATKVFESSRVALRRIQSRRGCESRLRSRQRDRRGNGVCARGQPVGRGPAP